MYLLRLNFIPIFAAMLFLSACGSEDSTITGLAPLVTPTPTVTPSPSPSPTPTPTPTPAVSFSASTSSTSEATSAHTITVVLSSASGGTVTVDYALTGTATGGGTDYTDDTVVAGTITFAAGDTSETIDLTVVNDTIYEGDETVIATLSNPTGGSALGTTTVHTHTISENDAKPTLNFSSSTSSVFENVLNGTKSITVSASHTASTNMTVDYAVSGGSATGGGTDFTLASGTATITAGGTSTTIDVSITHDFDYEGDETIIVDISNPSTSNSQLGSTTSHTLTITQPLLAAALTNTACVVLRDQTVKCWGGSFGSTPVAIPSLTGAIDISANGLSYGADSYFTAVTNTGAAKWWVPAASGSITLNDYGLTNVKQYAPGAWDCYVSGDVSMWLKTDGTVANASGALSLVGGGALNDVKYIHTFPSDAFAGARSRLVRSGGTVGWNDIYGGFYPINEVAIYGGQYKNVRKAQTGNHSTGYQCALRNNGTIRCGTNQTLPTTITASATDFTMSESEACASSYDTSACAALSDGSVQCWNGAYASTTTITGFGTSKIVGLSSGSNQGKFIGLSDDHKVFEWTRGSSSATEKTGF